MGRGNLLDVLEAALAVTLVIVGAGLAWRAFTGKRIGRVWLVSTEETYEGEPQWFHRVYTFAMGTLLAALGLLVLALIFF